MLYLFTNPDGNNTEGIGSVAQCQVHTYFISKLFNVGFVSPPFTNLQHYQAHDTQEEFGKDVTTFFNFPYCNPFFFEDLNKSKVVKFDRIDAKFINYLNENKDIEEDRWVEIGKQDIMRFADSNVANWAPFMEDLRRPQLCGAKPDSRTPDNTNWHCRNYFDDRQINFAIHITNFIEGRDNDRNAQREQYVPGNTKEQYFINLIRKFDDVFNRRENGSILRDNVYHIYSRSQTTGDTEQFKVFENLTSEIEGKVQLHIDEHPLTTLYQMIAADVRVLSNSSYSYLAALYGADNTISFARDNFQHKIPSNVVYTDYDGNFDDSLIVSK